MSKKIAWSALMLAAGVNIGLVASAVADEPTKTAVVQPHCPTEDSCSVDYRGGRWHIEPTVP